MRIIFDEVFNKELKDFLMTQDGIKNVDLVIKDFISEINIEFNKKTTPEIILNYINLFQKNEVSIMLEFNKNINGKCKTLTYIIDDMCCEYCYKALVEDLFNNEYVNSVKSNFDFHKPAFNIEFIIEYDDNYDENKLIQYIKEMKNA